jgi:hypothetical protein
MWEGWSRVTETASFGSLSPAPAKLRDRLVQMAHNAGSGRHRKSGGGTPTLEKHQRMPLRVNVDVFAGRTTPNPHGRAGRQSIP